MAPPLESDMRVESSSNPALYTIKDYRIYSAPSPALNPGADDCVVHVRANGICDLHFWESGAIGPCIVSSDYVLSHEGAGVVIFTGSNVTHSQTGDRAAIEPGVPCHECIDCTTGEHNLCAVVEFSGAPPYHGSIRRYHVPPAKYIHKLPESLTFGDGALLEPLSVALHAFERAPVRLGQPALIFGAGPIGLITLAAAKASGAFPLTGVCEELYSECEVYIIPKGGSPKENAAEIIALFEGKLSSEQPSVVYECTGVQGSVCTASDAYMRGGQVMVIGVGKDFMDGLPFMHLSIYEVDLKFIYRYHHSWPFAIRLLQSGYIDLKPLVTHTFSLEEAFLAMETAADRTKQAVKIHIVDRE